MKFSATIRRTFLAISLVAAALTIGCSSSDENAKLPVFNMGENIPIDRLIYVVTQATWHDRIGESLSAKLPQSRYLAVELQVTNSGAEPKTIPPLRLLGAGDQVFTEETSVGGMRDWLGMLRTVRPGAPVQGKVIFDVPRAPYRLRIAESEFDPDGPGVLVEIPPAFGEPESPLPVQ